MAESYCLKSCAECGQCGGCRAGEYAARCDIVKCCREKNHESCESCTRGNLCSLRSGRDMMPRKLHDQDRREAELRAQYRVRAAILAKWTRLIFWSMIAMNVVGLLVYLKEAVPVLAWIELVASTVLALVVIYGYFQMRDASDGFGTVAVLTLISLAITTVVSVWMPQESVLRTIILLVSAVLGFFAMKIMTESFRDTLSGISREMSGKWEKQWGLYKIGLYILLGAVLACVILGVWGLVVLVGGIGVMIFVDIREYVYLYQTAQVCRTFSQDEAG